MARGDVEVIDARKITHFDLNDDPESWEGNDRHSVQFYVTLENFLRCFEFVEYDDKTGKGFQRRYDPNHATRLSKEMRSSRYTPTTFYASIDATTAHLVREVGEDGEPMLGSDGFPYVQITLSEAHKIAGTDCQHRGGAFRKLMLEGKTPGHKERAAQQMVPVLLLLDPGHTQSDFLNLQKGKPPSKTLQNSMGNEILADPKTKRFVQRIKDVAHILDESPNSHLYQVINFSQETPRTQGIDKLMLPYGSSVGTSLWGGVMLCEEDAYGKQVEWVASMYENAWGAISVDAARSGRRGELSRVLEEGKMLRPLRMKDGFRGANKLILGIGNMLAWRAAYEGVADVGPLRKRIARIVDAGFDRTSGLSATDLRRELGYFAREFFEDLVEGGVEAYDGIPADVLYTFPPSTFAFDKETAAAFKAAAKTRTRQLHRHPEGGVGGLGLDEDILPMPRPTGDEPAPPAKPKRKASPVAAKRST